MPSNRGRRSNGEGTDIAIGTDGRYHASLSFGTKAGGKRDRRHVSGRTRAEVAKKLRALQEKHDAGLPAVSAKTPTVADWLRHWLDAIAADTVRIRTLDDYRSKIEYRVIPAIGHIRLAQLQPEQLESFYRSALRAHTRVDEATGKTIELEPLAAASVLKIHRILSRALKVAVQRGRVARNVCLLVSPPSAKSEEIRPLTRDEAIRVLQAARGNATPPAGRLPSRWACVQARHLACVGPI